MTSERHWESNVIAGAATVHNGQFLLLRRSDRESFLPKVWGIPAGRLNPGEDPGEACLRELFEETGLQGNVLDLVGYASFVSRRGNVNLSNVQLNFLVLVDDRDVRLDRTSHSEAQWISLDDRDSKLLDQFTRNIMIDVRRRFSSEKESTLQIAEGPGRRVSQRTAG